MKTSKGVLCLTVGLVLLLTFGFLVDQACFRLPSKLKEAEAKYNVLVAETELTNQAAAAERARLLEVIAKNEAREAELLAESAQYVDQIQTYRAEITRLQAQEPPTTPEIEALPIVINLRAQVRQFSLALEAANQTISLQAQTITLLTQDKALLRERVDSWRGQYEREHALRLSAEGLYAKSTKVLGLFKLSGVAKDIVIGGLVAGTIYGLVK